MYAEYEHQINGAALATGERPTFEPTQDIINTINDKHATVFLRKAAEMKYKQMMDDEALFLKNEYSLCADIDRHLSVASRNHMLLNAEYRKAKLERHAVNMWTTIVKSHTTTSNALMNKIKARNLIECCKQNGRHIEAYCIEYLEKIEEAKLLGDKPDEEELALKFLLHLDPTYS